MPPSIFRPKRLGVIPSRVLTGGLITNTSFVNPYPAWTYRFNNVITKEALSGEVSNLPVPLTFTIPELATARAAAVYNQYALVNMPLTDTTDQSFGTEKFTPGTAHVVSIVGAPTIDADGMTGDGNDGVSLACQGSSGFYMGSFTFFFRCAAKFTSFVTYQNIFEQFDGSAGMNNFGFHCDGDNYLQLYITNSGVRAHYTWAFTPNLGQWYILALAVDPTNKAVLTIDGVTQTRTEVVAINDSCPNISNPMAIGCRTDGTYGFKGALKDVLLLKGTSTAPASNYSYDFQDLRIAKGSTALNIDHAPRALNPITGACTVWCDPASLSATEDNSLTVYLSKDDEAAPTTSITYPTGWPTDPPTATWDADWSGASLDTAEHTVLDNLISTPGTYNETDAALTENT
jgi:hypothetical protein